MTTGLCVCFSSAGLWRTHKEKNGRDFLGWGGLVAPSGNHKEASLGSESGADPQLPPGKYLKFRSWNVFSLIVYIHGRRSEKRKIRASRSRRRRRRSLGKLFLFYLTSSAVSG
jgi:hypothetical protein